jgi:hypothetical protein
MEGKHTILYILLSFNSLKVKYEKLIIVDSLFFSLIDTIHT